MASMTPVRFIVLQQRGKIGTYCWVCLKYRVKNRRNTHTLILQNSRHRLSRLLRLVLQYRRERGRLGHVLLLQYGVNVRSQSDDFQQHRINRAGQREPLFFQYRVQCRSLCRPCFLQHQAAKEPVTVYVVDPPPKKKSTAYPVR